MNPGSEDARAYGCTCSVADESDIAKGMGKIDIVGCPIHGIHSPLLRAPWPEPASANPSPAPPSIKPNYVSAGAFALYSNRPPMQETPEFQQELLSASITRVSQISVLAGIYGEETIKRNCPPLVISDNPTSTLQNTGEYYKLAGTIAPGSCLSLLQNVYLNHNAVYLGGSVETTMLYETHRPNDRPSTAANYDIHLRQSTRIEGSLDGRAYLLITSAGSGNYGHWLTDDLPRLKAAELLQRFLPGRRLTILLTSFGDRADLVRRQTIEAHHLLKDVSIFFLDPSVNYQFDEVFYASPVSYHPQFKLRASVDFVRARYTRPPSSARKLFVTRPADSKRNIENAEEIEAIAKQAGYEVVEPGCVSFEDQLTLFKNATSIAGIMGAAMTNAIFAPKGASVIYLSCEGWLEPYYWDLADACGHRCTYVFGPSTEPGKAPYLSRFRIKPSMFEQALKQH